MLRRFPTDLPLLGALAGVLGYLAFGYTALYTELRFGRPSSTVGLGLISVPVWSVLSGIVGLLVGLLIRKVWKDGRANSTAQSPISTWWLPFALIGVVGFAASLGALDVLIYERQATPAILLDHGNLTHEFRANADPYVRGSVQLVEGDEVLRGISWGQNESEIWLDDLVVRVNDRGRVPYVDLKATGLDYVNQVHAARLFVSATSEPWLVVVISGRATGRRTLISVIAPDYRLIFQQRIERFWDLHSPPLEIRLDPTHHQEIAVVGPGCAQSIVLRPL